MPVPVLVASTSLNCQSQSQLPVPVQCPEGRRTERWNRRTNGHLTLLNGLLVLFVLCRGGAWWKEGGMDVTDYWNRVSSNVRSPTHCIRSFPGLYFPRRKIPWDGSRWCKLGCEEVSRSFAGWPVFKVPEVRHHGRLAANQRPGLHYYTWPL